jgi:hypothetical protein
MASGPAPGAFAFWLSKGAELENAVENSLPQEHARGTTES